jgi:hypothetical protein
VDGGQSQRIGEHTNGELGACFACTPPAQGFRHKVGA